MSIYRRKGRVRAIQFTAESDRNAIKEFLGDDFLVFKYNDNELFFLEDNAKAGRPAALYAGDSYLVYLEGAGQPAVCSKSAFEKEWEPDVS